jgi:hypothetical protein
MPLSFGRTTLIISRAGEDLRLKRKSGYSASGWMNLLGPFFII